MAHLGIDDERKTSALIYDRCHRDRELMSQESDHREYDKTSEERRADIADGDDQRVLVAIVGKLVVRAERYQTAPGRA